MPFTEDLTSFFDPTVFGTAATLQGGSTVNVIFDAAYLESFGVAGSNSSCLAKASDISSANIGQTLTINSVVYTISNRKPQDDGAIVLIELQAP